MTISVKAPSAEQIQDLAAGFGMDLDPAAAASFQAIMAATLTSYARVDELVEPTLPVKYPGRPATGRGRRRTRSMPGTGGATSRVRRRACCRASRS